jgi:hypothetical protein
MSTGNVHFINVLHAFLVDKHGLKPSAAILAGKQVSSTRCCRSTRAAGIIISQPTAAGQLRVARLTDRLQLAAARHMEALRSLAAGYWRYMRHPGWALAPDALVRPCPLLFIISFFRSPTSLLLCHFASTTVGANEHTSCCSGT